MARPRGWALALAMLPLAACKPKLESDAPERDVRSWTIAEIEAELATNDQALAGEGIMVAMAAPAVAPANEPTTAPGPVAEEPAPDEEPVPGEDVDDGDASTLVEPTARPPEPTPSVMPETTSQAEMLSTEGVAAAPNERRRAGRRRLAARRDAVDSRCERVCRLAEATCELETQICELAARHPDEPRYAQACLRAEQQCEAASRACDRCED